MSTQDWHPQHLESFRHWFHPHHLNPMLSHPPWTRPCPGERILWICGYGLDMDINAYDMDNPLDMEQQDDMDAYDTCKVGQKLSL